MTFRRLRRVVSIEHVLTERALIGGLRQRGRRWVGPCPVHGGDNPDAFVADIDRNLWRCFTACGGGDVVELVRRLDGVSYAEVHRTLQSLARRHTEPITEPPAARQRPTSPFRPFTPRLSLDSYHPFLIARGVLPDTAERAEVGAWHGRGMLRGCIAARLHDLLGQPLGYVGRRLDPKQRGRWVFPPGLPASELLYGWHQRGGHDLVVVVEGIWDVLRLRQIDVPAVALLGTRLSTVQHQHLSTVSRCVVLLDGDPAGLAAAHSIARRLRAHTVTPPPGHDPADLSDRQLRQLLRPALLF